MTLTRLESFPFDSRYDGFDDEGYPVYDRAVGARTMRDVFAHFFSDGVFSDTTYPFRLTKAASGLAVTVNPGVIIINGGWGILPEATTLTLGTGTTAGIIKYAVFARYDNNDEHRTLYLRTDASSAGGAVPEPSTTEANVTEYRIGYITVPSNSTNLTNATITNEVGTSRCPYAVPLFDIDPAEVLEDLRQDAQAAYDKYSEILASALDESTAGYLQNQINGLEEKINAIPKTTTVSGSLSNKGSGWNTFMFSKPFNDIPSVFAMPNGTGYTVEVKDVAASQFLYRLLKSGSATDDAVEVMWIASERGDVVGRINAIVDTGYSTLAEILADQSTIEMLATHEDAMTILYDDATARSAFTTTPEYMNIILGTGSSYEVLNGHDVMVGSVQGSDMAVAKYMAKLAGFEYGEVSSCAALASSASSMSEIAASSAAVNVMVGSNPAISAFAATNTAVTAIMMNSTAKGIVTGSESAFAKFVSVAAGLSISAYATFAKIAADSSAVQKVAASERALYLVCKSSAARTTWMNGSYAHTYYNEVYSTLHGASDDLFAKYETYYNSYLTSHNTIRIAYTNDTGGVSAASTGDHGSMLSLDYTNVATFEGVTLLSGYYTGYIGSQCYGSSQSKKDTLKTSGQYQENAASYVFVGGMTFGDMYYLQTKYATYVAK